MPRGVSVWGGGICLGGCLPGGVSVLGGVCLLLVGCLPRGVST